MALCAVMQEELGAAGAEEHGRKRLRGSCHGILDRLAGCICHLEEGYLHVSVLLAAQEVCV